jgi:5-methylcytosine-specific restriction endonuclease McrA
MKVLLLDGETGKSRKAVRLIERDGGDVCFYCNVKLTDETRTIDHKVPISLGGSNHIDNTVLACSRHNNMKGAADFSIFLEWVKEHPTAASKRFWKYYRALGVKNEH